MLLRAALVLDLTNRTGSLLFALSYQPSRPVLYSLWLSLITILRGHHGASSLPCQDTLSCRFFVQSAEYDIFTYNSLFQAHCRGSTPERAVLLYNDMQRRGVRPNHCTFPSVLKACVRMLALHKGQELHCETSKYGFDLDVFVQNSLIHMYSACGDLGSAQRVFDLMPVDVRDVVSWNSMITAYMQVKRSRDALDIFRKMREKFGLVAPDRVTAVGVLTTCARIGDLDLGRKIHAYVTVNGFMLDVFLGASIIDMYVKCGNVGNAEKVFDTMPERNVVCWTSMITAYSQSGQFKEAIELFRKMQVVDIESDATTVACVLSACGNLGALDIGRWTHAYSSRIGVEMNIKVKNALIDMYSKCGEVAKAFDIFDRMTHRDIFSWTAMIIGLAVNGRTEAALDLFLEMESIQGVTPNEITFLGVLSACSHGGHVQEGCYFFNSMKEKHNIAPTLQHYGCMVDLFGRANLLREAHEFIRMMPIEPDAVIWRSLLFACACHNNMELAELAAQKILQVEPRKCSVHVLLSNIYKSVSRWNDAKRVREGMKSSRIRKLPGCSFVEVNGTIHEFLVGDRSQSQTEIIHHTLLDMDQVLQGFVSYEPEGT